GQPGHARARCTLKHGDSLRRAEMPRCSSIDSAPLWLPRLVSGAAVPEKKWGPPGGEGGPAGGGAGGMQIVIVFYDRCRQMRRGCRTAQPLREQRRQRPKQLRE